MPPRKEHRLLTDDELANAAEQYCIADARMKECGSLLRAHWKASGKRHIEIKALNLFMGQTVYMVTNPELAARALVGFTLDDSLSVGERTAAVRDWLMKMRSDGYVAMVKALPGQEKLTELVNRDDEGGLVMRRSKSPSLGIRAKAPDEGKSELLLSSEAPKREWEVEFDEEGVDYDELPVDDGEDESEYSVGNADPWERD